MTRLCELICVLTWHRWHSHSVYVGYNALEASRYEVLCYDQQHCSRCKFYRVVTESLGIVEKPERTKLPFAMSPGPDPEVWN